MWQGVRVKQAGPGAKKRLGRDYYKLFGASTISNLGDGIAGVAYPWLASAITRNAVLVAVVAVAQRLPWLVFSLPAGVITDRSDRRRLMIQANWARAIIATLVAVAVALAARDLASPDELETGVEVMTNWWLYCLLIGATLVLGMAEVLYDNTAQTIMPSVVDEDQLQAANGRLWSTEQVANTLVGPVLGALMLAVTFALPFGVDAATFALSAILITMMAVRSKPAEAAQREPWKIELKAGFKWLWDHRFLRSLAITLGLLNALMAMGTATLVLFAQEVLDTSPTEFALMTTGGAAGGVIAGWVASSVTDRVGDGPALWLTIIVSGLTSIGMGLTSSWMVVWALFGIGMFFAVVWNVITVSLRQTIIPDELLGRVNSVYRFFGWGMIPIGALIGGLTIAVAETFMSREWALRSPMIVSGVALLVLLFYAGPRLTTTKIDQARAQASPTTEPSPR